MLRLHFTADDLARVTLARGPAPLVELGLAMASLQRSDLPLVLARWRQTAWRTLPRGARPLLSLIPPTAHDGPVFLAPSSRGVADGLDQVQSTRPADVRVQLDMVRSTTGRPLTSWARQLGEQDHAAWHTLTSSMRATYDALIAPSWPRIAAGYDAEYACRSRSLTQRGIHATLAGIARGARWRGATLEIPGPRSVDVVLGGHGLVLLPSMVWTAHAIACVPHGGSPATLVYPALTPLPLLDAPGEADALSGLLGTTRAAVLRLLTVERTTGDVATALAIANSSASAHAKALRAARLITSRREGKTMRHQCTPLGLDLLTGGLDPAADGVRQPAGAPDGPGAPGLAGRPHPGHAGPPGRLRTAGGPGAPLAPPAAPHTAARTRAVAPPDPAHPASPARATRTAAMNTDTDADGTAGRLDRCGWVRG